LRRFTSSSLISFSLSRAVLLRRRLTGSCLRVELAQIVRNALLDLRQAPLHLSLREVVAPEFTALNLLPSIVTLALGGNPQWFCDPERAVPSATSLPDCGQPHVQPADRLDLVEIAIESLSSGDG
jgi:hypothetical protein